MSEITYTQSGDYQIPDITITEQPRPISKYGRMRKRYLEEHRPVFYNSLVQSGKLFPHLLEIEDTANQRMEQTIQQMAQAEGITEQLKAEDQMRWVPDLDICPADAGEIFHDNTPHVAALYAFHQIDSFTSASSLSSHAKCAQKNNLTFIPTKAQMPVILDEVAAKQWLSSGADVEDVLRNAVQGVAFEPEVPVVKVEQLGFL